jgi:hypothetical protein
VIAITSLADAEPRSLEVSTDGRRAIGRYDCLVERAIALPRDSSFAQMAHAQGGGYIRRADRKVMTVEYVRAEAGWAIVQAQFASA